jgi:signal recognition particle subunit SRP54
MKDEPTLNDNQKPMLAQEEKLKRREYTLDDFRGQMALVAKPGFIEKMMGMLPGGGELREAMDYVNARAIRSQLGIIDAMTPAERSDARTIDATRRRRIAGGAGCEPHEVGKLIEQFTAMADAMTTMATKGLRDRMRGMGHLRLKSREVTSEIPDDDSPPPDEPLSPMPA